MFLGMQDFEFCPNLINFAKFSQILPKFALILPKFLPNLLKFAQIAQMLPKFAQILLKLACIP